MERLIKKLIVIALVLICLAFFLIILSLKTPKNYGLVVNESMYFELKAKDLKERQRKLERLQKRKAIYNLLYKAHVMEAQNY